MVTVIKKEPHPSVVKEVVCKHCGATLEYVPVDVQRGYTQDYLGDKDYYNFIQCPSCKEEVHLKD